MVFNTAYLIFAIGYFTTYQKQKNTDAAVPKLILIRSFFCYNENLEMR